MQTTQETTVSDIIRYLDPLQSPTTVSGRKIHESVTRAAATLRVVLSMLEHEIPGEAIYDYIHEIQRAPAKDEVFGE